MKSGKMKNLHACRPSGWNGLRSRFDSVFKGYFSDDLFTFSENQVPREPENQAFQRKLGKHKGFCNIGSKTSDFIGFKTSLHGNTEHHDKLMANYFAQTEALLQGKDETTVVSELKNKGLSESEIKALTPFKIFEGNRPTTSILIDKLTPKSLGSLIAMYEHKLFVQGVIWNIFSYD